jgi:hypothetical protein
MEVICTPREPHISIADKVMAEIEAAKRTGRHIDHILVNDAEWHELLAWYRGKTWEADEDWNVLAASVECIRLYGVEVRRVYQWRASGCTG